MEPFPDEPGDRSNVLKREPIAGLGATAPPAKTLINGGRQMKITNLTRMALVAWALMFATSAFAESAAVTNYQQQVTKIVDTWTQTMSRFNAELTKSKADLDALSAQSPPPADYEKRAAALRTNITNLRASMELATRTAEVDLGLLEFKPAKKEDGLPLPDFVKKIIAAKGIPLSKNVSFAPAATWNWKSNTLGSLSVKFNIKNL
jgi:hypothetical protein